MAPSTQAQAFKRYTPAFCQAGVDQDRGGSVGLSAALEEARVAETVVLLHVVAGRHNVDVAHGVARAEAPAAVAPAVMAKAPTVETPRRSGGRSECGGAECCDAGERENGLADHDVLLWFGGFRIRKCSRALERVGSRHNVSP